MEVGSANNYRPASADMPQCEGGGLKKIVQDRWIIGAISGISRRRLQRGGLWKGRRA